MIGVTDIQTKLWLERADGLIFDAIIARHRCGGGHQKLCTAICRTALCLCWYPGYAGGRDPYLSEVDELCLADYLTEQSYDCKCVRTFQVLDAACTIRKMRQTSAKRRLRDEVDCPDIADSITVDEQKPSRSWLNDFVLRHGFTLKSSVEIERGRLTTIYSQNLISFLTFLGNLTRDVPPQLLFNCDETMMSSKRLYKAVTVTDRAVTEEPITFQHMTAMVTINAVGSRVPPFIILPNLRTLPASLSKYYPECWFASSSNGWMTRSLFTTYVVNFVHWLSHYRRQLPPEIANRPAVLVCDGHNSRMNFAAMRYLRDNNV